MKNTILTETRNLNQEDIETLLSNTDDWNGFIERGEDDWWHGSQTVYANAPHGYDINVYDNNFSDKLADDEYMCDVYRAVLKPDENGVDYVSIGDSEADRLFSFLIKPDFVKKSTERK